MELAGALIQLQRSAQRAPARVELAARRRRAQAQTPQHFETRVAGLDVVELELLPRIERDGEPIVVPYTNYYIANDALIVPVSGYDPDMDAQALELAS